MTTPPTDDHVPFDMSIVYLTPPPNPDAVPGCTCEWCKPNSMSDMRMIVCSFCGNKRCPHATHHDNVCTNSNAPGQKGSSWECVAAPTP